MRYIMIMAMLAMVILAACSQNEDTRTIPNTTNTTNNSDLDGAVKCAEPRPEFCTKEYMPVCGDNNRTYGNKCEACSDGAVNAYTIGACNAGTSFSVRYAGAFSPPEWAQSLYKVEGTTFTMTRMTNDNEVTYSESRELSAEELGELQDILAKINDLEPSYTTEQLVTDVGYAEWTVGNERTRIELNIDEAYPAELLALRQWVYAQSEMLPDENGRIYKSRDPDVCARIRFTCEEGMQYFGDDSGCGCEPVQGNDGGAGSSLPALTECSEKQRGMMCTQQYDPVCAQVDTGVRCIQAPCPSTVYKTMGNACSACSDEKVYGYFPGECGDLEGKTEEDLANA